MGISYAEVLIATVVISAALVPALDAMHGAIGAGPEFERRLVDQYRVRGRLESVLADSFDTLEAIAAAAGGPTVPASPSDGVGTPGRLLVFVSEWDADDADGDGDGLTGGDEGILWVRVEVEGSALGVEALTTP